jgi:hypothetical protein
MKSENDLMFTLAQYRLSPDIPEYQRETFLKYAQTSSKLLPLANLTKEEYYRLVVLFDLIMECMDHGFFELANRFQAEMNFKLQGSRGVGGFETIMSSGSMKTTREELINTTTGMKHKKTWGIFRKKNKEEGVDE